MKFFPVLYNKLSFAVSYQWKAKKRWRMVLRKAKKCRRKLLILFQYKRDNFFAVVVITKVKQTTEEMCFPTLSSRWFCTGLDGCGEVKRRQINSGMWVERKVSPNNWLCISLLILLLLPLPLEVEVVFLRAEKTDRFRCGSSCPLIDLTK